MLTSADRFETKSMSVTVLRFGMLMETIAALLAILTLFACVRLGRFSAVRLALLLTSKEFATDCKVVRFSALNCRLKRICKFPALAKLLRSKESSDVF